MHARIKEAIKARDTLGGVFEVVALGLPPGLGSYSQAALRLDARLLGAVGSVPGVKGAEVGWAFENAGRFGTQVHDPVSVDKDKNLLRTTNNAAGLEGGITNGQPVIVRGAMKPISTTLTPIGSVDLATGVETDTVYERSDICSVPRAVVVGEAAVAFVLADALLAKLGGDSMGEIIPRYEALAQARLADLPMDNQPWRFGYDE
jgi:chorismate synthase